MGSYQSARQQARVPITHVTPELLAKYASPVDCLTAHLMLECSEVLAGVKPANLVSLVNRTRPCGRNLYHLWQDHQQQIAYRLGKLEFIVLQTKPKALLLLCFNRKQLEQQLSHAGIRTLLHKAGYKPQACLDELFDLLTQRIIEHDRFPHEIGLFIGYPPKDVAAFMGLVKLPFTCQALWKIYGNPALSLRLADDYRCCRQRMGAILATGNRQMLEIKDPEHPFFARIVISIFNFFTSQHRLNTYDQERRNRPTMEKQIITSADLFGKLQEIVIMHAGEEYRLRITSNNKLILTK